jgi:hypothetical protein
MFSAPLIRRKSGPEGITRAQRIFNIINKYTVDRFTIAFSPFSCLEAVGVQFGETNDHIARPKPKVDSLSVAVHYGKTLCV